MLLAACGPDRPLVRTEIVEVEVPVYKPLKPELTKVPPEPAAPAAKCRDVDGKPTVCNRDHVNYTDAIRAWGRKLAKKLEEIAGLQPTTSTDGPK